MTYLYRLPPAAFLAAALAAAPAAADEIEVTGPDDTALVLAIDQAVESARAAIGACREAGGEVNDCICANRPSLDAIRGALDSALDAHPEWKNRALTVEIGEGSWRTILLNGVARMAAPPDCG